MEALKKLGWVLLSVAIIVGAVFVAALVINGMAWVSGHVLEYLITLNNIVTVVCIVLLISLVPFRKTRNVPAYGLYVASFVFGVCVWMYGFAVTYQIWGGVGIIIGLILGIVGIVPLGIIAACWHSEWTIVAELIYGLVLTYGARAIALWLWAKIETDANRPANGQRASAAAAVADNGSMEWQTFLERDSGVGKAVERLSWLSPKNVEEFRTQLLQYRDCNRIKEFEEDSIRRIQGPSFVGDASLQQAYISLNREDGRLGDELVRMVGIIGKPEDLERTVAQVRNKFPKDKPEQHRAALAGFAISSRQVLQETSKAASSGQEQVASKKDVELIASRKPPQPSRRALMPACVLGLVLVGLVGVWLANEQWTRVVPASTPLTTGPIRDADAAYGRGDYATALRLIRPLADQGNALAQFLLGLMYVEGRGVPQNDAEAVKWFRLAADQGSASARNNLGVAYWNGLGVPRDYAEAVKWFRLAADQGNADAQYNLGSMHSNGPLPENYAEAVKWFRLAAGQGNAYAQYQLAVMYYNGYGVSRDYVSAHMWFNLSTVLVGEPAVEFRALVERSMTRAQLTEAEKLAREWQSKSSPSIASAGSPDAEWGIMQRRKKFDAHRVLAVAALNGTTGPSEEFMAASARGDYAAALRLLRPLADQGNALAQYNLGLMYADGHGVPRDYAEAVKWYRRAADHGDSAAQNNLGLMYVDGLGVPSDYAEAVKWFRLAADQGNAEAQFNLGLTHAQGRGLQKNDAEAVKWYRLAADQGDAKAQQNLGGMYDEGRGVPQNDAEAVKWYRLAADQGDRLAESNLGLMYVEGRGVPKSDTEAVSWFRKAADQGNALAQYNLGVMYSLGRGVQKNYVSADIWFNLAAAQGNQDAVKYRDSIEQRMTSEQLTEAQKLVREWKAKPGQ